MKAILLLTAAFLVNAFANGESVPPPRPEPVPSPEAVTVVDIRQEGDLMPPVSRNAITTTLKVRVASGGCTEATDFKIEIRNRASEQEVTLTRINKDLCEAYLPEGTEIELHSTALGLNSDKAIRVTNPLFVIENVTH